MFYKRTFVKGITWEVSGIIALTIINYVIFERVGMSITVSLGYGILRIGMYYLHERLWKKIKWYKKG